MEYQAPDYLATNGASPSPRGLPKAARESRPGMRALLLALIVLSARPTSAQKTLWTRPATSPSTLTPELGTNVALELGRFDALRGENGPQQVGLRYRPVATLAGFQTELGFMVTSAKATYAHVAVARELPVGDLLVVRPSFGVGAYQPGSGKDLGDALEFRSGLELSIAFVGGGRIGLEVYHLSNASLGRRNPGEESVALVYALPLRAFTAQNASAYRP